MTRFWNSSLLSVSEDPSLPANALNWDTSTPMADSITDREREEEWRRGSVLMGLNRIQYRHRGEVIELKNHKYVDKILQTKSGQRRH